MNTTETHRCECKVCKGITFTAPVGYVADATMVHNYAQMVSGPMAGVMAARGLRKVA
jgi:hypothetical protein